MLAFICVGFAIIILLILTESEICNKIDLNLTRKQKEKEVVDDSDVLEEKRKIETGEIHFDKTNIVIKDLTKYYGSLLAVNQLYLGINEYECFGLLGVNGAGKTTVFKMLTGDIRMSSGDIWINGINLKKNLGKTRKYIGYCPQFDALLDELTGKEILIIFSLIRGIAWNDAEFIAEQLAKDFDFEEHLEKRVKQYSGGNKRKLSTALAFIGDPPIIFLDEPTSGMDPKARRTIWNVLSYHRDAGKCLVLTSHNMEECEALCTRLTIMVNGVLKCLGSTQHLKSKFSKAYILNIKLTKLEPTDDEIDLIEKFVRTNFPNATMTERYQQLLKFYIPDTTIPISKMFGIMERSKKAKELNIEDYSLGQSNLEQVYLSITKEQEQH